MQATSSTDPSLALLEETAAYLRRLPLVPSTQELIRKIEAHLASPSSQAAAIPALEPSAWEGQVMTVAGTVLFSVSVENGQASLLAPVQGKGSMTFVGSTPLLGRSGPPLVPLTETTRWEVFKALRLMQCRQRRSWIARGSCGFTWG